MFTQEKIELRLKSLDKTKSYGVDLVHPRVLNECSNAFSYPLYLIFKKSNEFGALPDIWKRANFTALFKKGSKLKPSYYRPVSLTSIPCKLLERILADCLMDYLVKNNILTRKQHEFMRGKSCTTNLLEYIDLLTSHIFNGKAVDVLYTQFKKAFESVSHRKLYIKLVSLGIGGVILEWIKCFLENRQQRVVMGNCTTEWVEVKSGVLQESVLCCTQYSKKASLLELNFFNTELFN